MELTKMAKEEFENRLQNLENFIERKGIGSSYLTRARKIQRNMNIAILLGSAITIAGVAYWLMSDSDDD